MNLARDEAQAGVGASQWWRMASTTTSAGQAAAGGNPAKELTVSVATLITCFQIVLTSSEARDGVSI